MINTVYSSTTYVQQKSEMTSIENQANRNPGSTASEAMLERLAKNVPGLQKDDVKDLAANDFSPAKIADRISKFVAQGLENMRSEGRSEAEIKSRYEAAVAGVKKGFEEAREILDNLNFLSGDIAKNVNTTEDLTFKALEKINPSQTEIPSFKAYQTQVAAAERYANAQSFSLELKTQDGDTVSILFDNQNTQNASFAAASDGNGNSSAVFQLSQSQSSSLHFQVQGDLDQDELEAISKLIADVSQISDEFFNGDVQKAFEAASEFTMDKSELSSMNLLLTKSQSYTATSYREVQNNAAPDGGKLSGHLLNNFDQLTQRPALDFLQDLTKVSQTLLNSLVQQDSRYLDTTKEQQSIFNSSLSKIQAVTESLRELRTQAQQPVDDILPSAVASDIDA